MKITLENQEQRNWFGESILIKLMLIGILTLLLLIPSNMIQNLIWERQERQKQVIKEVTDKWAGSQLIEGPIMVIPYKTSITQKDTSGKAIVKDLITNIHILPENLVITAKAIPEKLHRGIFDAVVYNSRVVVSGKFPTLELRKSGINPEMVLWDKAKVGIGLSDLKGLKNNPVIKLGTTPYNVETDFTSLQLFSNNLVILPDLSTSKNSGVDFSFDLDLRGSDELNFLHLGKHTQVKVNGNWESPSFTGRFLPEDRKISDKAFVANWNLPFFNRPFPQQWIESNAKLDTTNKDASFGVKFLLPIDQYQKTMRTAKYAILIILLTFVSLFFTELLRKKKVHLLQYILIGSAMTVYYILLLSFSEQVGFNIAYLIASVATIVLIVAFIATLLKNPRASLVFGGILTLFYSFIFVIIQLQDLALLFGSIGLFIIISALMYLSAKIDWNKKLATETSESGIQS